jgi:uncharacterized LabA/DUF88 family protein
MPNKRIRVAVFIDGSNLYHKLKDLNIKNKIDFNYFGFCSLISENRELVSYRYYVGEIKAKRDDEKAKIMRANQQRLFSQLDKQGFIVEKGYLLESNGVFHEKGVDVKMAIDMIIGAYENYYDVAVLVSSDTDLIPAIKQVHKLGKIVEHVGFLHAPSFGLQKHAHITRLFIHDDLKSFVKEDEK